MLTTPHSELVSITPTTPTYCLGDFIWYDDNENGIQDSGEGGVSGVKVTLNTGAITTTDGDGKYEFCSLDNGSYSGTVDLSTLPSGISLQTRTKVQMTQ